MLRSFCERRCYPELKKYFQKTKDHFQNHKDLIQLDYIDYREDGGVLDLWFKHHFNKVPKLKIRFSVNSAKALIRACQSGMGLAFIPSYLIDSDLKKGSFQAIRVKEKEYTNPIMLVRLQDKHPSLLEKRFCEKFVVRSQGRT